MNTGENIQYYIDKTMLKDGEFYSVVITYLNGKKDDRSAQTLLWELSHSKENGYFFTDLDFAEFKSALDNMKISEGFCEAKSLPRTTRKKKESLLSFFQARENGRAFLK